MKLTRRSTLGLLTAGVAAAAYGGYRWSQSGLSVVAAQALKIPQLDKGNMKAGVRNFDLRLGRGTSQFLAGLQTPTLGINGDYLGPTLKFRAGEKVKLNVQNDIGDISTLHWHGLHIPASADGGPHQEIAHGASWHPEFEVKQHAATFWYHSHAMHKTGFQVYHGLAGMIIVEDEAAINLGLPQDYGVDDIPLVLQDRRFAADGRFEYLTSMPDRMVGMRGDTLLVNGTVAPYFVAKTDSLRLRLLNGSNSRIYRLSFEDGRRFQQISSDGGMLERPFETNAITLGPAERAEFIVDVSDGKAVSLQSTPVSPGEMMGGMMGTMMDLVHGEGDSFNVLEIRPDAGRKPAIRLPERLLTLERPNPEAAIRTRVFTLGMSMGMMGGSGNSMSINGSPMDKNRINETVKLNTQEIWVIENPTPLPHPFHIHDVQFRILDRDGSPPSPGEAGLKDTVVILPQGRVRLLLSFADYADPDAPYMYHCHNLEHEDAGMMGQFTVVS